MFWRVDRDFAIRLYIAGKTRAEIADIMGTTEKKLRKFIGDGEDDGY